MFKGEVLKSYLDREGISQEEFGERVGATQQMISYLIKGFKQPSIPLLKRISEVTGISADELI